MGSRHCGPEKAHKHLAHKQFLGHSGHRSSRPGTRSSRPDTRTKMFMFLGFRTQHINFWPLATGRETPGDLVGRTPPPHPGSHRKNLFMFMCLFLSWKMRGKRLKSKFGRSTVPPSAQKQNSKLPGLGVQWHHRAPKTPKGPSAETLKTLTFFN